MVGRGGYWPRGSKGADGGGSGWGGGGRGRRDGVVGDDGQSLKAGDITYII